MDASGSHQLEVMHDVVKKRLTSGGQPFAMEREEKRGTVKDTAALLKERRRAQAEGRKAAPGDAPEATTPPAEGGGDAAAATTAPAGDAIAPLCETCYGAEEKAGDCCNSCEAVRDAYR